MKVMFISLILMSATFCTFAQKAARINPPEIVSVCEILDNRSQYNGQNVAMIGRWSATDEGFWIYDECAKQIKTGDFVWKNIIYLSYDPTAPTAFAEKFDPDKSVVEAKIKQLAKRTEANGEKTTWAVVYGRIETSGELQTVLMQGGTTMPAGFGHLNSAPAQLHYRKKDLIILEKF